ncbi:MAG: hypothetical protein Kow0092_34190 [Deferrisomatales bacterium]
MGRDDPMFRLSYPAGFLARTAATSAAACAVGLLVLRWFLFRELGDDFGEAFHTVKTLREFLAPALAFAVLVVLLVGSVAVMSVALFASHKIAGPLFRLQRVAGHLGRRVLVGRIHLRAADRGKPVAAEINEWVEARKSAFYTARQVVESCERALRDCEAALARGEEEAFRGAADNLARHARELVGKLP